MNLLKNKKWLLIVLGTLLVFVAIYKYTYKPHKKIEDLSVFYKGNIAELINKTANNPEVYLNKAVQIKGKLTFIDEEGFVLNDKVYCQLKKDTKQKVIVNDTLVIKGVVIGYDDLLEELKLNNCIIKNK